MEDKNDSFSQKSPLCVYVMIAVIVVSINIVERKSGNYVEIICIIDTNFLQPNNFITSKLLATKKK